MKRNPHKYFQKTLIPFFFLFSFSLFMPAFGQGDATLKECWEFSEERILNAKDASDNELLFISSLPDTLQALNQNSGKPLWKTSIGGAVLGEIIISKSKLFVLNEPIQIENSGSINYISNRSLISLDSVSGITNWKTPINSSAKLSLYSYENNLILIDEHGVISFINLEDGKTAQKLDINQEISTTYHFDQWLIFGTHDKKILFFSLAEGKLTKEIRIEEVPAKIIAVGDGSIIWADKKGSMRFISVATQKIIWKKRFGGELSSIAYTSSGILVSHSIILFTWSI